MLTSSDTISMASPNTYERLIAALRLTVDKLVQPPARINDPEHIKRARLLNSILLVTILAGCLILGRVFIVAGNPWDDPEVYAGVFGVAITFAFYMYHRSGHTSRVAAMFIGVSLVLFTLVPFIGAAHTFLPYAVVPILLTAIFFSVRWVAVVSVVILVVTGVLMYPLDNQRYIDIWYFLIFGSMLIVTYIRHQTAMEQIRQTALTQANERLCQSEENLQQLNHQLEARVTERTHDLATKNIELASAWEAAKQADLVKSQFLASMSHELRTPLNAILNFTEFVSLGMLGEINERQTDALNKSLDSGRHLLALINDVLDITKIESGMMRLFIEDNVDVYEILDAAESAVQSYLQGKPVSFITEIEENLPAIVTDRRRLRQILLNLLSNACKFTEQGSVRLCVRRQGDDLCFSVIDTGPGIAPQDHDVIFEPFKQTETGIRHAGGTGLGLPISKRLIEANYGRLWVESELGRGAAFHFAIPVRQPELLLLVSDVETAS